MITEDYVSFETAKLLKETAYPYEALPQIHDFITELGATLPEEIFEKRGENI